MHTLKALAVDDGWSGLVVLLLGDPHLLEGREGGENGTTDPDGVLALRWCDDLDLHGGWSKSSDLLLHTVGNSWVHGGSSRHDNVAVEILTDIDIALHDGVEGGDMDTARLKTQDGWGEESLWCTETLVTDGDDLSIWKLVGLLEGGGLGGGLNLLLEVESNVTELLLDVADDFALGGGGESVSALRKNLHEVVGQIATSHVDTGNGVWKSETLVNWDNVGNSVTGIKNDTGGTSGSVEGKDGLNGDVERWGVESLENDLCHLLSVGLWVDWGLSQQDWVLLWCNAELVVEGVVPNLLHVVPVGNNTVLDWVAEGKDTTLGLCLISYVRVLLTHTDHDTRLV